MMGLCVSKYPELKVSSFRYNVKKNSPMTSKDSTHGKEYCNKFSTKPPQTDPVYLLSKFTEFVTLFIQ